MQPSAGELLANRVQKHVNAESRRLGVDYSVDRVWLAGEQYWVSRVTEGGFTTMIATEPDALDALLKLRQTLREWTRFKRTGRVIYMPKRETRPAPVSKRGVISRIRHAG